MSKKKTKPVIKLSDLSTAALVKLVNVLPEHKYLASGEINRSAYLNAANKVFKGDQERIKNALSRIEKG